MSLKIVIPGADFSGLGNPKVESLIEGLPADNLAALYLFDTGVEGAAWAGPAVDKSGFGRDAPLVAASTALKSAGGVNNGAVANEGFAVLTPVGISSKFTVFGVSRNNLPASAAVSTTLMPWSSSGDWAAPLAPSVSDGTAGAAAQATAGRFQLNQQNFVSTSTGNFAEMGVYATAANVSTGWAGATARQDVRNAAAAKGSWIAWALSFDAAVGYTLRGIGSSVIVTGAAADAAIWLARQTSVGGRHIFGAPAYLSDPDNVRGEMALAGIYDGVAKSVADMDVLLARVKTKLAARIGATIL
ncbi:hypothetical protein [Sphingobium sp.]|uniref:hypothetical protein n=1 Tax=Sphingobium sp. TaxID=1912891 RepID=UPI002E1F9F2C